MKVNERMNERMYEVECARIGEKLLSCCNDAIKFVCVWEKEMDSNTKWFACLVVRSEARQF